MNIVHVVPLSRVKLPFDGKTRPRNLATFDDVDGCYCCKRIVFCDVSISERDRDGCGSMQIASTSFEARQNDPPVDRSICTDS